MKNDKFDKHRPLRGTRFDDFDQEDEQWVKSKPTKLNSSKSDQPKKKVSKNNFQRDEFDD